MDSFFEANFSTSEGLSKNDTLKLAFYSMNADMASTVLSP